MRVFYQRFSDGIVGTNHGVKYKDGEIKSTKMLRNGR